MKTVGEIIEEIDCLLVREKQFYNEAVKDGGINCYGAGVAEGALDLLKELKEFILQ